jgi:hypothetical protein
MTTTKSNIQYNISSYSYVVCELPKSDHFNPLNAELNPICHMLALFGAHHILHVSRIRVKSRTHLSYPCISSKTGGRRHLRTSKGHL